MKNKRKRKKNSKKKIIIIVIASIIILLLVVFLIHKISILNKYDITKLNLDNYDKFLNSYNERTNITIDNIELNENEYLSYQNIKFKNILGSNVEEDYFNNIGQQIIYKKKDAEGNVIDSLSVTIRDTYLKMFNAAQKEHFITGMNQDDNSPPIEANISDYLKENKIENDLELFGFLSKIRNKKPNIFTSTKDIKDYYGTHLIASIVMPKIDKFTIIEGEYNGYIFHVNKVTQIGVEKNNESYIILLNNKTEEETLELLNSLIIE